MTHDVDIDKMVVSSKFPLGKKSFEYFMGYKVDRKVRPIVETEEILMKLN